MPFLIERAERRQSWLRFSLSAASGGGKTWSALLVAKGLVESMLAMGVIKGGFDRKIGVIDTERKSAKLYDRIVPFDVIELGPPYTVDRYLEALKTFVDAGYSVVIIDQLSHGWAGAGGLLESQNAVAKSSGDNWGAWADITPIQNAFIDGLLSAECHLIVTMRAKTEWTKEEYTDARGNKKARPKRIGMAPIQRAGTEYEFTSLLYLDTDGNTATAQKDRTGLFPAGQEIGRLSEKHGAALAKWLYAPSLPPEVVSAVASGPEKLEAIATTREAAMGGCRTLPDLARVFEQAKADVAAVDTGGYLKSLAIARLVAFKDKCKARLEPSIGKRPDLPMAQTVEVISADQAIELEGYFRMAGVAPAEFFEFFVIDRFSQLPAARWVEARDWLDAKVVTG